ncbi:MAG: hypothetical protein C0478_02655 [Planctomyces sp.]|nr:hypothetical protein [Planctomyces sp.]
MSLFFFNTLFFLFWSSSWQKACCRVCMRKTAWLELFANILGFIGIPVALANLFDCYFGADKNIGFRDLDKANHAFKTGRYAIAANLYRDILSFVKVSSGIKYNYGMACERMGESRLSAKAWQSSIQDCGNYAPAYEKLRDIYCRSGDTASLAKLDKVFVWSYWQACPLKAKEILDGASFEP